MRAQLLIQTFCLKKKPTTSITEDTLHSTLNSELSINSVVEVVVAHKISHRTIYDFNTFVITLH